MGSKIPFGSLWAPEGEDGSRKGKSEPWSEKVQFCGSVSCRKAMRVKTMNCDFKSMARMTNCKALCFVKVIFKPFQTATSRRSVAHWHKPKRGFESINQIETSWCHSECLVPQFAKQPSLLLAHSNKQLGWILSKWKQKKCTTKLLLGAGSAS